MNDKQGEISTENVYFNFFFWKKLRDCNSHGIVKCSRDHRIVIRAIKQATCNSLQRYFRFSIIVYQFLRFSSFEFRQLFSYYSHRNLYATIYLSKYSYLIDFYEGGVIRQQITRDDTENNIPAEKPPSNSF